MLETVIFKTKRIVISSEITRSYFSVMLVFQSLVISLTNYP